MLMKGFLLSLLFLNHVYGQIDPTFCNFQSNLPQQPFPIPEIFSQFQMSIEINDGKDHQTVEMDEYYDSKNNLAKVVTRFRDFVNKIDLESTQLINANTNELFLYSGDVCRVFKANETNSLGFTTGVLSNGSEYIISGIALIHQQNPNQKEVYLGTDVRRGVDVKKWGFCSYNNMLKATQKIIYYISDPDKWTVAVPLNTFNITPVEIQIENKVKDSGDTWTNVYAITKFRPGLLTNTEDWLTPRGLYCPGRSPGRAPPKFPKSFKLRSFIVRPVPFLFGFFGSTTNIRETYDFNRKLVRIDYTYKNSPLSEVHDFNTGLRYVTDKFRGNCTITTLDNQGFDVSYNGDYITMKDPQSFFDFDSKGYHYTGRRMVGGVNTDHWIGIRAVPQLNATEIWEWYFMATGWNQESTLEFETQVPVKLVQTYYGKIYNNATQQYVDVKWPIEFHMSDFDASGLDIDDFDISRCYDTIPNKHFVFQLPTDYINILDQFKINLKIATLIGLERAMKISAIRISRLELDFQIDVTNATNNRIDILFTVLDKSSFYGPVENLQPEITLDEAASRLNETLSSGKLVINFRADNLTFFDLVPLPNSLRQIERNRNNNQVYFNRNIETLTKTGFSGGEVAGLVFSLMIVGLIAGALFAYFYVPNNVNVPTVSNLINPLFK